MNGVQTRFKCKLDVKRCKRFVFPPSSLLPRSNALKTKAIRYFQTDRTLTRIVSPPLWDGDLLRETFKGDDNRWGASSSSNGRSLSIVKWKGETLTQGIEGDILMIADLYGDWREEIITALPGEIRIYTTNLPAKDRRTTLMQDGIYRSYVAHRSMGYPQAPVPSYYLGE